MDQRNAASQRATPREHSHSTSLAVQGRLDRRPDRLKALARHHKYNDLFTAELAAWCAEVHEHLCDLEDTVGVELLLMGGNAASLRFDAIQQRGSRDNDYLTTASHADIGRLMDAFAERLQGASSSVQARGI
jgi:hypothetical protein